MERIDLNCDLGESFGAYTIGRDEEIIPHVSSANVACGFHASDPVVMEKTVRLAVSSGVAIGAHPGLADMQGFGRRTIAISADEARSLVLYQIGALEAFCRAFGTSVTHVKPHGALYNMAAKDAQLADAVCDAIAAFDGKLLVYGPAGSHIERSARERGLRFVAEVFADRAYADDGSLVPRTMPGAMIDDESEAIARVIRMIKERQVKTVSGRTIPITADSVCVHGDGAQALAFVIKLREAFALNEIAVRNPSSAYI